MAHICVSLHKLKHQTRISVCLISCRCRNNVHIMVIQWVYRRYFRFLQNVILGCKISSLQWRHNERDGVSISCVSTVCSSGYSGGDQRNHQSSASPAFVRGIHRWPVNSPNKGPVTRKMFPLYDVTVKHGHEVEEMFSWRAISMMFLFCACISRAGVPSALNRISMTHKWKRRWQNDTYK